MIGNEHRAASDSGIDVLKLILLFKGILFVY